MRRSQPLERRTALRADPEKALSRSSSGPLDRSAGLARGNGPRTSCADCGRPITARSKSGRCRACHLRTVQAQGTAASVARTRVQVEVECPICGGTFETTPRRIGVDRKTCSRGCAAELKQRRSGDWRKGSLNPMYRDGSRAGDNSRPGGRRWYAQKGTRCENPACRGPRGKLDFHHVCYRQHVRKAGGDEWDARNGMTLCSSCHSSHHHRGRVIALVALPDAAVEFVIELLGAERASIYLRRYYAGDDPRLRA